MNEPALRNLDILIEGTNGAATPPMVTIPQGNSSFSFPMRLPNSNVSTLCGTKVEGLEMEINSHITVNPVHISSIELNTPEIFSGGSVIATVTLEGTAPAGGANVILQDDSGLATTPNSVFIPEGQSTGSANITTFVSRINQLITVTGYLNGWTPVSGSFVLKRSTLQTVEIGPASVIGGVPANALVKVNGIAAESNIIALTSSNLAAATVPSQVVIVKGQYKAAFNVTTKGVKTDTLVTISGSMNTISATDSILVKAAKLTSLTLSATVEGGSSATGSLQCDGIMPPGGTPNTVALSDNSASLTTPISATIPILTTGTTFTVNALAVAAMPTPR